MNATLEEIKRVRSSNNDLWMALIDVALQCAPAQAKAILRDINRNDVQIGQLMEQLSRD